MLDSVCKFIRRHIKKNDQPNARERARRDREAKNRHSMNSVQGRRMTGRWTQGKPPLQEFGKKQLPLQKRQQERKRTSRTKEAVSNKGPISTGGAPAATYEISMKDIENKKETNIRLQIRRPTGCPNSMKREIQKLNLNPTDNGEKGDMGSLCEGEEGEGDIGTQIGGTARDLSLEQQILTVVVTAVDNDREEDWYPGKERDDIDSDNPYFAEEKYKGEMKKAISDSDTLVSSDLISECDEPGAITIGQRLSDVYDFNRDDVYE